MPESVELLRADSEPDSSLELGDGPNAEAKFASPTRKKAIGVAAVATFALVACAAALRTSTPGLASARDASISLAEDAAKDEAMSHWRISYGLHKATCPAQTHDKSEGAKVTLDSIKKMVGAKKSDEVKFWWVYPEAKKEDQDDDDWSAETQFSVFGGYKYVWGEKEACLALTPVGEDLTVKPSDKFPKGDIDWHKQADNGDKLFAWVPPTGDKTCEHGCFVYKLKDDKTVFKVV